MTKPLRETIEQAFCEYYASTPETLADYGLDEFIDQINNQILSLLEGAIGEEWHHNSDTWCAGANARRKDMLDKLGIAEIRSKLK